MGFFSGFKSGFKEFGHRVNSGVTLIVLVPVYFIGVGLTSVIGRLARKNFLDTSSKDSYWIPAKNDETMEDHRHSF